MKDPDSSKDAKSDVERDESEDMSLADLLGADASEDSEAPRRAEAREDEPDSGMVNLAKMVAGSSTEAARTPSIAPPPAEDDKAPKTAGETRAGAGEGGVAPAQKKSSGPLYALIIVVVLAAAAVVFVMMRGEGKGEEKGDKATEALLARLEEFEKDRAAAEAERKKAEAEKAALMERLENLSNKIEGTGPDAGDISAEEKAEMEEIQDQLEEAEAKEEELAEKAEQAAKKASEIEKKAGKSKASAGEETKVAKAGGKKKTSGGGSAAASTPKKKQTASKSKKSSGSDTKKGGASELDSLLGGSNEKKKEEEKKSAQSGSGGGQPAKLSRADINKAMGPVRARAQKMCAKYSTGVVQVKVTVGGNGRVKSASSLGAFANSKAGKCVAMAARTAKFPKFSSGSQSFTYPITLK